MWTDGRRTNGNVEMVTLCLKCWQLENLYLFKIEFLPKQLRRLCEAGDALQGSFCEQQR